MNAASPIPIKDALILITDKEATFLNEDGIRQICLEHLRRDLNDVLQNDPDRQWAREMLDLICTLREKARNRDSRRDLPKEERRMHEQRYDEILNLAEKEYDKKPARKTLPQGPSLMSALRRQKKLVLFSCAMRGFRLTTQRRSGAPSSGSASSISALLSIPASGSFPDAIF